MESVENDKGPNPDPQKPSAAVSSIACEADACSSTSLHRRGLRWCKSFLEGSYTPYSRRWQVVIPTLPRGGIDILALTAIIYHAPGMFYNNWLSRNRLSK